MSSRRSILLPPSSRRPSGPRCHGGASSLLRLGLAAVPQRAVASRTSGWRELDDASVDVEHVVGWPQRARGAAVVSS